jgi:putative spermidine/putrescine transport system permease protein
LVLIVFASFTDAGYVSLPPQGVGLRWYRELINNHSFFSSLTTSLWVSAISAPIAAVIGVAAAVALARSSGPLRGAVELALLSPLLVPAVVVGLMLLQFYVVLGMRVTLLRLIAANVLLGMPYVVRTTTAAMSKADEQLEAAARTLGARRLRVFWRVTWPLIRPAVLAGTAFAGIVAFEDVGAALFLSRADATTLPVWIYTYVEQTSDPLVAAACGVLIVATALIALAIDRIAGIRTVVGARSSSDRNL